MWNSIMRNPAPCRTLYDPRNSLAESGPTSARVNLEIVPFYCAGTDQKQPRGKVSPWSTGVLQAGIRRRIEPCSRPDTRNRRFPDAFEASTSQTYSNNSTSVRAGLIFPGCFRELMDLTLR